MISIDDVSLTRDNVQVAMISVEECQEVQWGPRQNILLTASAGAI